MTIELCAVPVCRSVSMRRGVAAAVLVLVEGSLLSLVSTQLLALGRCPSPPAVDDFDFDEVSFFSLSGLSFA